MSSFRRVGRGPKSSGLGKKSPLFTSAKGVKAWTGGIHLTSVGLNDLDNVLGGGQPLGTSILVQEDRWTRDLAISLLKYWCAEAISQDHELIIPTDREEEDRDFLSSSSGGFHVESSKGEIEDLLMSLPRNLYWDKLKERQGSNQNDSLGVLEEDDEQEEKEEEGLEIAWQYKKSVQQERLCQPLGRKKASSVTSNVFCHSYDLSGKLKEQTIIDPGDFLSTISLEETGFQSGFILFRELVALLKGKDQKPVRMLFFRPRIELLAVTLPLFLSYIRKHSLPVVLLIYSSSCDDARSWSKLSCSCDVLLSTEGFSSRKSYPPPPEFRLLQGILTISKVCTVTAATANGGGFYGDVSISKKPSAFIYGFKRDRRKLHLSLLHIPPEDFAQAGGSVGSGVRSGAGKAADKKTKTSFGCSSNLSGSALDF